MGLTVPLFRPHRLRPTAERSESVPYTIAGLLADFNADRLRATLADAASVTTWNDDSGNGNAIGNTGTNRPTFDAVNPQFNGHASVNFAKASTQYLFGSSLPICTALSGTDKPMTVFVVCRRSTKVSAAEDVFSLGNSGSATNSYISGGWNYASSTSQRPYVRIREDGATAQTLINGSPEITDLGAMVMVWSLSGNDVEQYAVGATQNPLYDVTVQNLSSTSYSAHGAITFDRFSIGALLRSSAANASQAEVARVLVYNRELSDADRSRICQHLWNTYATRRITAPTDLDGCQHWYDASTLSEAEDAEVLTWADTGSGAKDLSGSEGTGPTVSLAPNGNKVLTFTTDQVLAASTASDWTFLHDGSDWSMFVVYRVVNADRDGIEPLVDTCLGDPINNTGVGVYHDNTGGGNHKLNYVVGASDLTDEVLNHATQAYGSRPQAWHVAEWTYESGIPGGASSSEENYQLWLDNEHYANVDQDAGVTLDTGAPDAALTVGSDGTLFAEAQVAEIIIYSRKLGKPTESQLVHEYLARKWNTSHQSLVAGNGLPNTFNDATPHRGFPGLLQTASGVWLCGYRLATSHSSAAGVCCVNTSADGIRWSPPRVIYDDSTNYDWRGVNFIGQISGGRIFIGGKLSETDSTLLPYTAHVLYSDDGGSTWSGPLFLSNETDTWFHGLGSEVVPEDDVLDYDEGVNSIVELSDGTLLAHFMALVVGGVYPHILQCSSTDGGDTWTEPSVIYYGRQPGLGNFPQDERCQEPVVIRFPDDGELLMAIRADVTAGNTTGRIYFARSTDNGATWSPEDFTTEYIEGYGDPRIALDPNDPDGVYLFHREASPSNLAVWRYSADRGVNWTDARAMTNLHATTGTLAGDYPTMTYTFPAHDEDGNLWIASGLEDTTDSDIFVRRWADVEA